ncbi:site-specific integrase [Belnapia sp. F-4-1]|uniref:tyrosine-type recombinase/integrase n=1 Tax=Belnapia sp. F-4-1 TaxID=1545443 RepID=UPI0005BBD4EF|nr:site-specific integrase [Belnapia sp. F-4-1]
MATTRLRTEAHKLTCPPDKAQVYHTDHETQHLRLKVARSGRHVWDWRGPGGTTSIIGIFDPTGVTGLTYLQAKARADQFNAELGKGTAAPAVVATPAPVETISQMVEHYIKGKIKDATRKRRERTTEAGIRSMMKPLLHEYGDLPVVDASRHILLAVVRKYNLAGREAGRKLVHWYRAAWNYCDRERVLPKFGRDGLPLVNAASHLIEDTRDLRVKDRSSYATNLSDAEIVALLKGIQAGKAAWVKGRRARPGTNDIPIRWPGGYLMLEFLLHTGCRKMEAQTLHITDIKDTVAQVDEHKTDRASGKPRSIYLSPLALDVLRQAAELRATLGYTGALVFPSQTGTEIANCAEYLDTACRAGGLERRLVPHSLRSVYINFAVRQKIPLTVVSRNVGHTDIRTTQKHYEAIEAGIQAEAVGTMAGRIEALLGLAA